MARLYLSCQSGFSSFKFSTVVWKISAASSSVCRIIAERHAVRGPCDLFLRLRFMRSAERVVRHRAARTVPPIVEGDLIVHRHRRRRCRGRSGCRRLGRRRGYDRCCGRVRRWGDAARRGRSARSKKNKRCKNCSAFFHNVPHRKMPCRGRTCAARSCMADDLLREGRGPGMPGPYRAACRGAVRIGLGMSGTPPLLYRFFSCSSSPSRGVT